MTRQLAIDRRRPGRVGPSKDFLDSFLGATGFALAGREEISLGQPLLKVSIYPTQCPGDVRGVAPHPGFELRIDRHRGGSLLPAGLIQAFFEIGFESFSTSFVLATAFSVEQDQGMARTVGERSQEVVGSQKTTRIMLRMDHDLRLEGSSLQGAVSREEPEQGLAHVVVSHQADQVSPGAHASAQDACGEESREIRFTAPLSKGRVLATQNDVRGTLIVLGETHQLVEIYDSEDNR